MGNTNEKTPLNDDHTDEEGGVRYSRSNSLISTRSQNPDVNGHVLPPLAFQVAYKNNIHNDLVRFAIFIVVFKFVCSYGIFHSFS